jgi:ATP adenylyltransferase
MEYILGSRENDGCVFCHAYQETNDKENLVLYRGNHAYVILNKFPYNTGHSLIIPYKHVPSYEDLEPVERAEMMELLNQMTHVLRCVYQPDAFNIGANIGTAAGAGIAPHVHFHILPRWSGDTNFLTTVTQTRVIPEELCDTYAKLKAAWEQIFSQS